MGTVDSESKSRPLNHNGNGILLPVAFRIAFQLTKFLLDIHDHLRVVGIEATCS